MSTPSLVQEIYDVAITKVPGLTLRGACELTGFGLPQVKTVMDHFYVPAGKSPYSSLRKALNAHINAKGMRFDTSTAHHFRDLMGFQADSPREDPKKGMDNSSGSSTGSHKNTSLFEEQFAWEKQMRKEGNFKALYDWHQKTFPYAYNPFKISMMCVEIFALNGMDYVSWIRARKFNSYAEIPTTVETLLALALKDRDEAQATPSPETEMHNEPQPPAGNTQIIKKLVSNLKESMEGNTNTLPDKKIPIWSNLDDKQKASYFKALVKSQGPLQPTEEIVVDDPTLWEEVGEVAPW
jgi:hypothetical protein